ncbi:unnamed protein product [Allacma fusca]|uniref:Uncharacterized protein n=1 Tax=Allacma fusca TaxID=39272 RepID=A0A8J2PD84_9HEXA|nr:unnamed protein product [Allacma fusca]
MLIQKFFDFYWDKAHQNAALRECELRFRSPSGPKEMADQMIRWAKTLMKQKYAIEECIVDLLVSKAPLEYRICLKEDGQSVEKLISKLEFFSNDDVDPENEVPIVFSGPAYSKTSYQQFGTPVYNNNGSKEVELPDMAALQRQFRKMLGGNINEHDVLITLTPKKKFGQSETKNSNSDAQESVNTAKPEQSREKFHVKIPSHPPPTSNPIALIFNKHGLEPIHASDSESSSSEESEDEETPPK